MFFQALSNENDGNAVALNSFFCNLPEVTMKPASQHFSTIASFKPVQDIFSKWGPAQVLAEFMFEAFYMF